MSDYALKTIAIPDADGPIAAYGGLVVVNVAVEIASGDPAPSADLLIYDNPSAGSGDLIGVVPATGPNGTYTIARKVYTGIYLKNVSGWTGSVGIAS